jgi:hypothetical protein
LDALRRGELELADPAAGAPRVSGPARLSTRSELVSLPDGAVALKQSVTLHAAPGSGPVRVDVPRALRLPGSSTHFIPLKNGVARRGAGRPMAAYEFAGSHALDAPTRLALPMVSESNGTLRLTVCTDPTFTAGFGETLHWIYADGLPPEDGETRVIQTVIHSGEERSAVDAFYATALADVRPGPDWLHDVAMVGYDFLSRNGQGWFADIDALAQLIEPRDRPRVTLALHGWYDLCGRYAFDIRSGQLDRAWTAFPNAKGPDVLARAERKDFASPFHWAAERIHALRPVEMTLADMHRRIAYARSRGFRVALYFADGLNSCEGVPNFDPTQVLRWGGWSGPETRGRSFAMNPLHPDVPRFFEAYLAALLTEYGREIDALIWDETFYVQGSDLGTEHHRGYAGRAMMNLVKRLASSTSNVAFLSSDDVGAVPTYQAPYSLMAHGTYQDSSCSPKAWPYGLWPNFRNTLWSCNWAPMKAFDRTEYAADTFDVPVAVSNGYAEDVGIAEMRPDDVKRLMALFNRRKNRRMDITWIEQRDGVLTYRGRPVRAI